MRIYKNDAIGTDGTRCGIYLEDRVDMLDQTQVRSPKDFSLAFSAVVKPEVT